MEIQHNKIKTLKIIFLQYKYKNICTLISNIIKHIDFIESEYLIDNTKKNSIFCILYNIIKNLNSIHNKFLLELINKTTKTDTIFAFLLKDFDIDESNIEKIMPFNSLINKSFFPYTKEENELNNIILDFGLTDLLSIFKFLFNVKFIPKQIDKLIQEFNTIFIPISINFFNVDNSINNQIIYWRIPTNINENDHLEQIRELWIKNIDIIDNNKNFIKIEGIFINDKLSLYSNTCQINLNYLYTKKTEIINKINCDNKNLNIDFVKRFIKYDYIGNIYCMKINEYIDYLTESINFYNKLSKTPFINIIKNFISSDTKINKLYSIILLLLLGNDNNIEVASLLLGIIKEKKNNIHVYNLIIKKLPDIQTFEELRKTIFDL